MYKLILLAALISVAYAGGYGYSSNYGFGAGGYGGGYGHGHGGYGHGHGGYGHAKVNVHQTPHNYQYGLQESGPGYNKYVHQGASTYGGYGYGGHGGY